MNRFYPFFPFPPRQMQERHDLQNPQNNGIDPRYGGPPYGYGSYPPAPPPIQPQGLPDINDRYARYPGYQQGRPPLPPSHYPYSYPNQQRWRQPPQPSHRSFMDDLGSFAKYLNPFGSAHAEEMPSTNSSPQGRFQSSGDLRSQAAEKRDVAAESKPWWDTLATRRRLTHLAIQSNEGGAYEIAHAGKGDSGYSFGIYQGDLANGDEAQSAFADLLKLGKKQGLLTRDDQDWLKKNYNKKGKPKDMDLLTMKLLMNPILSSDEGKKIVDQMDYILGRQNFDEIDTLNLKSVINRQRALDPIEQANYAIWSNRANGLKETGDAFFGRLKNATTEDSLDWVLNQENFRKYPSQKRHHLESIGQAIEKALAEGILSIDDIPEQSQKVLNAKLKGAGSSLQYEFKKAVSKTKPTAN